MVIIENTETSGGSLRGNEKSENIIFNTSDFFFTYVAIAATSVLNY